MRNKTSCCIVLSYLGSTREGLQYMSIWKIFYLVFFLWVPPKKHFPKIQHLQLDLPLPKDIY